MNLLKKCTAMLLTGAIALSCAACSGEDTAWIMRNGELEMPAGAYINSLIESYYEASSLVEDSEKDDKLKVFLFEDSPELHSTMMKYRKRV